MTLEEVKTMRSARVLKVSGKRHLSPLYERILGQQFTAVLNRLNSLLHEVRQVRLDLERIERSQDDLDRRLNVVAAGVWDTTAMSRRLMAIEDRLANESLASSSDEHTTQQEPKR